MPNASGSEDDDQVRLSRAYNHSIYLMLVVPYGALGAVGFMVYRHLRVRAALERRMLADRTASPDDPSSPAGDRACSLPSRDDAS